MRGERPLLVVVVALAASLLWASAAHAAFPGANGKIAFDNFDGSDDEIYVINPDGSGLTPLTSADASDIDPAWSPDGKRIAFVRQDFSQQPSTFEIWIMNEDGSGQTRLTRSEDGAQDFEPAFSASGQQVFFRRFDGAETGIWVVNIDGSGATAVSPNNDGVTDISPAAAANGQLVAFTRFDFIGDPLIYTMTPGGANPMAISNDHGEASFFDELPNFSPDSTRVAFDRCPQPEEEDCDPPTSLFWVPATGGAATAITTKTAPSEDPFDLAPAYAPDGSRIVFWQAQQDESSNLAFVGPNGGPVQPFVEGERPDWQPLPSGRIFSCYGRTAKIVGTDGNDKLVGTPGNDVFKGRKGDDTIKGKGGDDVLCGNRGDDRIFGGKGEDTLIGGKGSDFLKGGSGADQIFGGTPDAKNKPQQVDICPHSEEDKTNNCKQP